MNSHEILTTESGRYYINATDNVIARSDFTWADVFDGLNESEEQWRIWLFDGLLTAFSNHIRDPLSSFKMSADDQSDELTFLISGRYGAAIKYRFVMRQFIFFDWLDRKGFVSSNFKGKQRKKFPKGFNVDDTLRSLSRADLEDMWHSILINEDTRISTDSSHLESSLRYRAEQIREMAQSSQSAEGPLEFLNRLFHENVAADDDKSRGPMQPTERETRLSVIRFLVFLANRGGVVLPARVLANNTKSLSFVYTGFMKGCAIRHLAGLRRAEIEAGMSHLTRDHMGQRQLRLSDIFIFFAASNYGTSDEFAPEFLNLTQIATSGHLNNLRPYLNGIKDFHQVPYDEYRKWNDLLGARNSMAVSEGPFSLFRLPPHVVRNALPAQVKTYENRTVDSQTKCKICTNTESCMEYEEWEPTTVT